MSCQYMIIISRVSNKIIYTSINTLAATYKLVSPNMLNKSIAEQINNRIAFQNEYRINNSIKKLPKSVYINEKRTYFY